MSKCRRDRPAIQRRPKWPPARPVRGQFEQATLVVALLIITTLPAASAPGKWTQQDINRVADLAVATAQARLVTGNQRAWMLLGLAEELRTNGQLPLAHSIGQMAGALIGPPYDFEDELSLGGRVQQIVGFGDEADAQRLLKAASDPSTTAAILGGIGAGRAQAGNTVGAEQAVASLSAIPDSYRWGGDYSVNDRARDAVAVALVKIDPFAALRTVMQMHRSVYRQEIVAKAAADICASSPKSSPRHKLGVAAMNQAANALRAFDATDTIRNLGYAHGQQRTFGVDAAAAIATCESPQAAVDFLVSNFTGQDAWRARQELAQRLTFDHKNALAHAVAPKPDPADKDTVLLAIDWLSHVGDRAAARTLAEQAQARLGNGKPWNLFLWEDMQVGAYDAATSVVLAVDPQLQGCHWPRVITEEVTHGDIHDALEALPQLVKPLRGLSGDTCGVFVDPMFVALARAGLGGAARPDLDAYRSALLADENINYRRPGGNIFTIARLAGIDAMMGDIPRALDAANRAGPLTVKHNCDDRAAFSYISCPSYQPGFMGGAQLSAPERFPLDKRNIVRGPKAIVLGSIAAALGQIGNLTDAWRMEKSLEAEPLDAFREPRDKALMSIATELINQGDPRGAFSTVMHIANLSTRWQGLVALARLKPGPK